jgi:hypothetical protein
MSAFPWLQPYMSCNLLHLLSTNHKCTHACFIKTNAAQNKIIVQSSPKILKNTRRKSAASCKHLFIRLRLRLSVM